MNLEEMEFTSDKMRSFVGPLQPAPAAPHLKSVKAFVDIKEDIVEITFFFRHRFLHVKWNDGFEQDNPKLRMDFEMSLKNFLNSDFDELRDFMLQKIHAVDAEVVRQMPGVLSVRPIFDIKAGLVRANQPVKVNNII